MEMLLKWGAQLATYMKQGGFVMWPLAIGTAAMWYGIGYRFFLLRRGSVRSLPKLMQLAEQGNLTQTLGVIDAAVSRSWEVVQAGRQDLRERLDDALFPLEEEMNKFSLLIKVVVVIAPLAGLLGTVTGMIETFDSLADMTLFSSSGGIAGGISQALISTQMGLIVAIPGLLAGQMLWRRQETLEEELERVKELFCATYAIHEPDPSIDPDEVTETNGSTMRQMRKKKKSEAEVDMSPLIDMVFILLIFFMVSTTFVKDLKVELERPSASSSTRASTKALRIHIDRGGAIYVDGQPTKSWMLQSRVRQVLKSDRNKPVLVITDRLVRAERLIEVVDQCRLAGAKDVGVATRKEAG